VFGGLVPDPISKSQFISLNMFIHDTRNSVQLICCTAYTQYLHKLNSFKAFHICHSNLLMDR